MNDRTLVANLTAPHLCFPMPVQKLAFGAIVVGLVLIAPAAGAQAPQPSAEADGLLHVSLALSRDRHRRPIRRR